MLTHANVHVIRARCEHAYEMISCGTPERRIRIEPRCCDINATQPEPAKMPKGCRRDPVGQIYDELVNASRNSRAMMGKAPNLLQSKAQLPSGQAAPLWVDKRNVLGNRAIAILRFHESPRPSVCVPGRNQDYSVASGTATDGIKKLKWIGHVLYDIDRSYDVISRFGRNQIL